MALTVNQLVKTYGSRVILDHVSFRVEQGEVFALLGTNGAGKTTMLECIEGLRKYGGSIQITGKLGIQLQSSSLPDRIKAWEAADLFARWNGGKRAEDTYDYLWQESRNQYYDQMSTGQKRRFHLALALSTQPDILILDEPTAGLDVESRVALHEEIRKFQAGGNTVLLASHDMAEVENLCDRVGMLKGGKLVFCGSLAELQKKMHTRHRIDLRLSGGFPSAQVDGVVYRGEYEGYLLFETANLGEGLYALMSRARETDCAVLDVRVYRSTLEEQFMQIAGEGKA